MLPFFYHKDLELSAQQIVLNEETSKHCIQVLRMQQFEQLKLTNGLGVEALVEILEPNKKNTIVKVIESKQNHQNTKQITIAMGLLKNASRFEWFLEKAAELGIYQIIPLITKRTERQHFKFERFNNILISAMLQSQQTHLTQLMQPINFEKAIEQANAKTKLLAHCVQEDKKELFEFATNNNVIIFIGPEGDFTNEEIAFAWQHKFLPVSLGNTRLRTETAGIAAASVLMLH